MAPDNDEIAAAVRALSAADGRPGAAAIWRAAAARALRLRRALGAAVGEERPPRDGEVLEELFLAPLHELPDAREALAVATSADGMLAVQAPTPYHRELLAGLTGAASAEEWRDGLAAWAGRQPAEEAAGLLQELGVPAFAAPSPWAAADGADDASAKAMAGVPPKSLAGVLAIEIGGLWAAPLATKLLGDLGARVLKVEAPTRPDGTRNGPGPRFRALNAGKEVARLDLRRDEDRERLLAEVGPGAVVVENNTARVLPNLGLPPELILERGAALVRLPASRLRPEWRGLGSTIELAADLGRDAGEGPRCAPIPLTDPLSGAAAALAAVHAIGTDRRLQTIGQLEDIAAPLAAAAAREEGTG